jgi:hypothetical protein
MALPIPPEINQGQIALDPVNGIVYYKDADGNLVSTTWSWLRDDTSNISTDDEVLIDSNLTVSGDLVIQGDTVSLNTTELLVEDNFIILNSNVTGSPTLNAGIEIERGSQPNVILRWNESVNQWQVTVDGTNFYNVLYGDQQVFTTSNVIFNSVTSDLIGDVTGTVSDISNHSISDLSDVVVTGSVNGQLLQFDGTNWVNTVSPSNEPMGHEDKSESTISFNEGTRTFSIAPVSTSFTVWCAGKRFVKTGTETVQIPDTSGLYYIYYNSSGVLSYRTDYFIWDEDAPTAYVYWNEVDNKAYFFADERHGITLDWATHEYLHRTRGAAIANGFGANNYILNGDGSLDSHAKLDIANGTFFDEDLQVDITHSNTPTTNTWEQVLQGNAKIPVFYRINNHWIKDVATEFPLKQGASRPQYNLNTAGTWSTTDIANNRFGVSWIIATNNLNEPIIAVLGQGSYTDNGSAQAEFYSSLNLDGFPIVEFRPLYKIIYECKNSYTNTPSARITDVIDLRSIISSDQGVGATAVSDHGSMTGLSDDDHPQYLRTDGTRTATSLTVSGSITTNSFILDGIEIDAATPSDTNVLKYDAGLNKYIPGAASTVASLDDLTDVIISGATPNQILKFDGTNWVNEVPALSPASVTVSSTNPESPQETEIWFDNISAGLYIYYDSSWVEIGVAGPPGQDASWATTQIIKQETGATPYIAESSDLGKLVTINSSSDVTITINESLNLSAGQRIDFIRLGTGQITFAASSVTLNATPGLKLRARYSAATLICLGTDDYILIGDLSA